MAAVLFDEAKHEYRAQGRLVPSVTKVLSQVYDLSGIPPAILEHKRQLGWAVHRAIEFDLDDDLDETRLAVELRGYLDAWRRWRSEREYEHTDSERRVYHPAYGYAGTLDLRGRCTRGSLKRVSAVIDLKSTVDLHPAVALQTAAYRGALAAELPEAAKYHRLALQLKPDGTYFERWYDDPKDWPIWLACLSMWNWRALNRL